MIQAGDKLYIITHAYHHYIGEVTEVLGIQRVALKDCIKVHSCSRKIEDFFRDGCKQDTTYDYVGVKPDVRFFDCTAWNHKIPGPKK